MMNEADLERSYMDTTTDGVLRDSWHKMYSRGWGDEIPVKDAYAHPAKFSRNLIFAIYDHAMEMGWIKSGDTVLDCFGGVALGSLPAIINGLHWTGVELEERFVKLGNENIEAWESYYKTRLPVCGSARLIQGDSRQLRNVIEQAGCCVSSPPFAQTLDMADTKRPSGDLIQKVALKHGNNRARWKDGEQKDYGSHPANLGNLRATDKSLRAVICSPAFAECLATNPPNVEFERKRQKGRGRNPDSPGAGADAAYGQSDGQLGAMKEGSLSAVISSPPFAESLASDEPEKRGGLFRDPKRKNDKTLTATYGTTEGNLGMMKASISSPPYESALSCDRNGIDWGKIKPDYPGRRETSQRKEANNARHNALKYGDTEDNLGNNKGSDFWSAARLIVEQVHQVLAQHSHAIWVLKGFIRNKQYVDFPAQWQELCEAVGFKTLHIHRAHLVEQHGGQINMLGETEQIITERKSFFRRLAESKGSPAVNFEVVLCMEKQ
jgi:hypothetical protein